MAVSVRLEPSARLRAARIDPHSTIDTAEVERWTREVQLPAYPRVGDEIEFSDGANRMVIRFCWTVTSEPDALLPIAIVD